MLDREQIVRDTIDWFSRSDSKPGYDFLGRSCQYRVGGKADSMGRCAIGCHVDSSKYDVLMEGSFDDYRYSEYIGFQSAFPGLDETSGTGFQSDFAFLSGLQQAHDNVCIDSGINERYPSPEQIAYLKVAIVESLRRFADRWNIDVS